MKPTRETLINQILNHRHVDVVKIGDAEEAWYFTWSNDIAEPPRTPAQLTTLFRKHNIETCPETRDIWLGLNRMQQLMIHQRALTTLQNQFRNPATQKPDARALHNGDWFWANKKLVLRTFNNKLLTMSALEPISHTDYFPDWTISQLTRLLDYLTNNPPNIPQRYAQLLAQHIQSPQQPSKAVRIVLQRQGCSQTLRTNHQILTTPGVGNASPGFHLSLDHWGNRENSKGWHIVLHVDQHEYRLGANDFAPVSEYQRVVPIPTLEETKKRAAEILTAYLGKQVTIADEVEAYTEDDGPFAATKPDVHFERARYEPQTNTIRSVPENYCLVHWDDKKQPHYDMDAATDETNSKIRKDSQWRVICPAAANHVQPKDTPQRLAWLISEYRKYGINKLP